MLHPVSDTISMMFNAAYDSLLARKPILESNEVEADDFVDLTFDPDFVIWSMSHVLFGRRSV